MEQNVYRVLSLFVDAKQAPVSVTRQKREHDLLRNCDGEKC
jgi:hypothetical protein